jgi:Fur family zinc uptake transcriptional regulator
MLVEPLLTPNQQLVLRALADAASPLSAYAILERLQDTTIRAPLQVYRALEKLMERGLVHRLESLNAFVACEHAGDHAERPVAFAICESCGWVEEFADTSVANDLDLWSKGHGFIARRVTVELRGLCGNCNEVAK